MGDLISRQAAIDAFDLPIYNIKGKKNAERVVEYIKAVLQRIKELPSAQPEPITLNIEHELTKEEYEKLRKDMADAPIVLLPSAEPERRWIPCSERLPERMNTVLVTCVREVKYKHKKKNISVKFAWCCPFWEEIGAEKAWTICGINQNDADKFKVVAWMPLPEPWRGEEKEDET